jgi:hypothetical protein
MEWPISTPEKPAIVINNLSTFPSSKPISFQETQITKLGELIKDWLLLNTDILLKDVGYEKTLELNNVLEPLEYSVKKIPIFLGVFSQLNIISDLRAINTRIANILEPISANFMAKENLLCLQKRVLAMLRVFAENKAAVHVRIPSIVQAGDIETLSQIACCFVGGIELSDDAMKDIAYLYAQSDMGLKIAIQGLHLRSRSFCSLNDYFIFESSIKNQEKRDCALAAFLSYAGSANLESHRAIIRALEIERGQPINVSDEIFIEKIEKAYLENDVLFIMCATKANIRAQESGNDAISHAAGFCRQPSFWFRCKQELQTLSSKDMDNALRFAALKQNPFGLGFLLNCGADLMAKGPEGLSALSLLGARISRECLIALLQQKYQKVPPIFDKYICHAFKPAFQNADIPMLEMMVPYSKGKKMQISENTFKNALESLIKCKNIAALILIYKIDLRCKESKETVVGFIAEKAEHYPYVVDEIFPALIKAGADPYQKSIKKNSMIDVIMRHNRQDLLRLTQTKQWDKDEEALRSCAAKNIRERRDAALFNNSPILKVVQTGNIDCAKIVLEYERSKINDQARDGKTALHWAVEAGNTEMVELLLNAGIKIDITDNQGLNARDLALSLYRKDIADLIGTSGILNVSL